MTAKQIEAIRQVIRRMIRSVKDSKLFIRIFPDRPVTSKGTESRMGKGKGTVEYWATWVPRHHVVFEIGGGVRYEVAKKAFDAAKELIPALSEMIVRDLSKGDKTSIKAAPTFVKEARLKKATRERLDEVKSRLRRRALSAISSSSEESLLAASSPTVLPK